jgi:uncharacterized protein (DUF2336 family)
MASNNKTTTILDQVKAASSLDQMLVALHDAQRTLTTSNAQADGLARQRVVQTIAHILDTEITKDQRDMVADILLSLVRQAEVDLRESLAERLCVMEGVPEDLVLFLAHDIISVAEPVLKYSTVLTDQDLLYIIQSKGCEYWQAIAQRKLLDSAVIDALVDRNDESTAKNLLLNDSIALKESALEAFAELSKYSEELAEPLLARKELPQKAAMELFWHVSAHLRQHIIKNFNIPKDRLDAALQDALEDFSDTTTLGTQEPRPSALMTDLARQYGNLERINDAMLVKTLRRGQVRFFLALMSQRTGLTPATIHDLMRQVGGQGMAVACRAVGVAKESFVSLFLLSRSLTRGDQSVDALELRKAIKYYDAMTEDMASSILADSILQSA